MTVSQNVVFKDIQRDGSGNITSQDIIPIQRNHLYKVILTPKYNNGALVFDEIDYAIQVNDWQTGETLVFAGDEKLTAQSTPSFYVEDALYYYSTDPLYDGTNNPDRVVAGLTASTINVIVTSQTTGTMMECPDFDITKGSYGLINTTNDANGNLVETYQININANALLDASYTFKINNAINTAQAREFVLTQRPKLPLEYVAEGDIKSSAAVDGVWELDMTHTRNNCWAFSLGSTVANFGRAGGDATTHKGGVKCKYDGVVNNYHFASMSEWCGIIPGIRKSFIASSGQGYYEDPFFITTTNPFANDSATVHGEKMQFTSQYDKVGSIAYAIRFTNETLKGYGNTYRCAYKYEWVSSTLLKISSAYIGLDDSKATMTNVKSADFWTNAENNHCLAIRYFPVAGVFLSNTDGSVAGSSTATNETILYYLTEAHAGDANHNWFVWARQPGTANGIQFYSNNHENEKNTNRCLVRLFADD